MSSEQVSFIITEYQDRHKDQVIKVISDSLFLIFNVEPRNMKELEDVKAHFFDKNGKFYVAELEGKVIGTIAVIQEEYEGESVARVYKLYVEHRHRGKGVGRALLERVFEFCNAGGHSRIVLSTHPRMVDAIRFYQRNGFVEFKRYDDRIFFEKACRVPERVCTENKMYRKE